MKRRLLSILLALSLFIPQAVSVLADTAVAELPTVVSDEVNNEPTPSPTMTSAPMGDATAEPTPSPTIAPSPTAEDLPITADNWWSAIKAGDSFDIGVQMYKWPYAQPPSFSMGNGALTGNARLTCDETGIYAEIDFKAIDMGSVIGHLIDFWYIKQQDKASSAEAFSAAMADEEENTVGAFLNKFGTKCEYFYPNNDTSKPISYIRIPLDSDNEMVVAGLESDFKAMGQQLCVLNFDFTNAIEKITGQKVEKVKKVDAPVISSVLSAEGDSFEIFIKIPKVSQASDGDIYYMISADDDADLSGIISKENKYEKELVITLDEAVKWGGTFNVFAVGVKDGYENSVINIKKMTFSIEPTPSPDVSETPQPTITPKPTKKPNKKDDEIDVNDDGKYWVKIALYNAASNQISMGNVAFKNNTQALITTSDGKSVIRIASNPVSIPPYYSALQDVQFQNVSGQWQEVRAVKNSTIKANDGTNEHTLSYLQMFEFEIPDTSEEFIPVKISVPYTPMDDIVDSDGGYIEARIKLFWKSIEEASSSAVLVPDDEDAVGSSKYSTSKKDKDDKGAAVDMTDKNSGIKLTADKYIFPSDTVFKFFSIKKGELYSTAKSLLGDSAEDFRLYTISAESDDKDINGISKLYFPVGDDETDKTVIYRIRKETETTNAGKTQIEHTLSEKGDFYVISVKEFGSFAVVRLSSREQAAANTELPEEIGFSDIKNHWASDYIKEAVSKKLFSGVDDSRFAPDDTATRGMLVTVLGRMMGNENKRDTYHSFEDIKETDYYYPHVIWAYENGIAKGISDTSFAPDLTVTREQLAVMLYNCAKMRGLLSERKAASKFTDDELISEWAREAVYALAAENIIGGREDNSFDPKATATRAEIAVILVRFMKII